MTGKCRYCNFTYETEKEQLDHLNERHVKCGVCCEVVFDKIDEFAICPKCRENWDGPQVGVREIKI